MSRRASLVMVAVAACGPPPTSPDPEVARVGVFSAVESVALDVLFVVDSSGGTEEWQTMLAETFPEFLAGLDEVVGELPDLHIGVISADVGAGGHDISNCSGEGDDGFLQNQPRVTGCTPPAGAFISNADGDLATTFSCIAQLGVNGCGFEQHLESMRRALDASQAFNAGFLRPEAHLLVVVLADEDDCSAFDGAVFDPTSTDPQGPLSSFRCFEFGVDCEVGNEDRRAAGPRDGCHAREDSPYLYGVREYSDFLRSLKDGPQIMVTVIAGDATRVEVGGDPERPDNPVLVPSCRSDRGIADASVRLTELAMSFPSRGAAPSICGEDLQLRDLGLRTGEAIATGCLQGEIGGTCAVHDVRGLDTDAEQRTPIASCATTDTLPCFRLETDARCTHNADQLALVVDRATAPPSGTVTVVDCDVP